MRSTRDIAAFEARAADYEQGWLGRLHKEIADRTVELVVWIQPSPHRVLDIGCGTGYLLQSLARRCSPTVEFVGIDPAPAMVRKATSSLDSRSHLSIGVAERLPYFDNTFDLVVTTTSFDHWSNQPQGLRECARVLVPGGILVLVDQFSFWLAPTMVGTRRAKARTKKRCTSMLTEAGLRSVAWHHLYAVIIGAATATA
jgi:ubiquinone/menaquinone biosynthesis C-methylase UbiE